MTAYTSQTVASRLGYGLGRVVRFFLHDSNLVLRWFKRLTLLSVVLFFSVPLLNWIIGMLTAVAFIATTTLIMAKVDNQETVNVQSKSQSLWDRNGPNSLWRREDESQKW